MGIAVLVRPAIPIEASRVLHLHLLRADRLHRAAIVVDVTLDGHPVSVAGIHMSHLLYGSPRNFAELRRRLQTEARHDALIVGRHELLGTPGAADDARLEAYRQRPQLADVAAP